MTASVYYKKKALKESYIYRIFDIDVTIIKNVI